jgi:hypothetical protein
VGWTLLDRASQFLLLLAALVILTDRYSSNSNSNEVEALRKESQQVMSNNVMYLETKINKGLESQDSYQIGMSQKVYILEQQVRLLQADKKQNNKIINNNQSNAVIYQNSEPVQKQEAP